MNKFIISESEKQRILEMHQNATSRQYLMEDTSRDVVYTTITLYYDLLPNKVKKRVQYMSFSTNVSTYKTEDIQTIKSFDLGGTVLSPTAQKMSPEKVITGTLPYNKSLESLIGKGASTSTANTLIPTIKTQDGKVVTSNTSLSTIVTVVEQQRQTPTQKESDLTRIVKRVINERQYLTEEVVGDYFNTMNSIFNTQIAAYVKTGLNLPVKLQLNSDGTVSILWNNAKSFTTTSSLSQAITYNEGAGDPKSKVTRFGNELSAGWQKVSQASQNKDVQKSNTAVSAAIRSSINSVINTYFKNQPGQK